MKTGKPTSNPEKRGDTGLYILTEDEINQMSCTIEMPDGNSISDTNRHKQMNTHPADQSDPLFEEIAARLMNTSSMDSPGVSSTNQEDTDIRIFPDAQSMEKYIKELSLGNGTFSRSRTWERTIIREDEKAEKLLTEILEHVKAVEARLKRIEAIMDAK